MNVEKIYKKAKNYGIPIVRSNTHKFLIDVVANSNAKNILEIGTAVGYSGIAMLDASLADLVTIEHNKEFAKQAKRNFKKYHLNDRAKIVLGDCMVEIAKMVASKQYDDYFDIIFLDGPKAQYDAILENLLFLLKPNGILIADNVLFHGYIEGNSQIPTKRYKTITKRLNDFIQNCKNNPKLTNFKLINIDDGIIFAQKVKYEN